MRTVKEEQLEIASANISLLLAIMAGKVKTDGRHREATIDGLFELKGTNLVERDGRYYQLTKDGKNRLRDAFIAIVSEARDFIVAVKDGLDPNEFQIEDTLAGFLPPPRQGKVED